MKWLTTCASLLVPTAAIACPPTNQHPSAVAEREALFWQEVTGATDIVYGVVDHAIVDSDRTGGSFRILHVYKGNLRVGQRLPMAYAIPPSCPWEPPGQARVSKGSYGVILVDRRGVAGAVPFTGFLGSSVERLFSKGYIKSARGRARLPNR